MGSDGHDDLVLWTAHVDKICASRSGRKMTNNRVYCQTMGYFVSHVQLHSVTAASAYRNKSHHRVTLHLYLLEYLMLEVIGVTHRASN